MSDEAVVRLGDEAFRVRGKVPLAALMRFAHTAKSTDTHEIDQWDAIYRLCRASLAEDEDFDKFLDVAERVGADDKTLMLFVRKVLSGQTERPTSPASDSSDGPEITEPSSESEPDSLHLRVVKRLEDEGRPDKALMILMAQEQQKAASVA